MSYYTISTGSGGELTAGIQMRSEAFRVAQREATRLGEPVYVTGPGIDVDATTTMMDCGHAPTELPDGSVGTGYGRDAEGRTMCYGCCTVADRAALPMADTVLAWHFLADSGKLRDGSDPPPDGRWLSHKGKLVPCESGLHASVRAIDALSLAPGSLICRVECGGRVIGHDGNKIVCRKRRILWRADATETLRRFARRQALGVIHLWSAPDVVRRYLETGDESLRAAARAASVAAARAAAWDASGDAARAAAWAASVAAARAAARDAAWYAAWDAARAAAMVDANDMLTEMLLGLGGGNG